MSDKSRPVKLKRIYLTLYIWSDAGGIEQVVTSLSRSLKRAGIEVFIFAWAPVGTKNNQYEAALRQHGIRLISPRDFFGQLASDWEFRVKSINEFLNRLSPFLSPLYLAQAWCSGRSLEQAKESVRGYLRRIFLQMMQNYTLDTYMKWRLSLAHLIRPASVVHQHGAGSPAAIQWARNCHLPVVYTEHTVADANNYPGIWEAISSYLNQAHCVTAVSPGVADGLVAILKVEASKVVVIPNPIEFSLVEDVPSQAVDQRSKDHFQILFVGRLDAIKGLPSLIEAVDILRLKGQAVELVIVGDGPERDHLLAMVKARQLEEQIRFLGKLNHDQLPAIYRSADIFALPSMMEGLPLVALEAMSFSLPVVASNIPAFHNIVTHGQSGFLLPPGDAQALAEALDYLLNNPEERKRMGESSRQLYELGGYSPDRIAARYLDTYNQAITSVAAND